MRRTTVTLLLLGLMVVSCGEEADETSSDPKGSGGSSTGAMVNPDLPDNLCDEVLTAIPGDYGVGEVAHSTEDGEASCSLASESGATTLELTLTSAGAEDLDEAFESACDDVVRPEPEDRQDRRCTRAGDGEVVQAVRLSTRSAVLLTTLRSDDTERIRTAAIDLALVESAVATA